MDGLPSDPSDQNSNNGSSKIAVPPPFGSSFNPPTIPTIPENPDPLKHEHYSEAAQHKQRDEHGHFVHSDNSANPQTSPARYALPEAAASLQAGSQSAAGGSNPSSPSIALAKEGLPPIIEINQNSEPTYKKDPPAFGFFITNPVTYFKAFLNKLIKRQAITIKIPVLAIIVFMVGVGGFGVGFQSGINWALFKIFPNYSPILHRNIAEQGVIQKSSKGYFLQSNNKNKTIWTLQSTSANVKLADYVNQNVQIKGNLTSTPNLIDVSEVISFEPSPTPSPTATLDRSEATGAEPNPPDSSVLPALFSGLTWEVTQSKTLLFTSGKRRIEQEGVYLESSQITQIPKDFINYYTNQLKSLGFKQTLNSSEPNGTTITFAKDELFLTFGVKNVYKGSGENKQLVGYKAYLEHN